MPDAPLDPSAGTIQSPPSDQNPAPKTARPPDPSPSTPNPQTPLGATWGGVINVPNNFLGAGVTGKGWTITGESVVNGQRVVTLGRRIEQTGAFETHQIDGETFKAAKAYKDEQGGMSKSKKPPTLKENELGKAIDPQGDLIPEFFDAATRSYRLRLPGGRTPEWVPESLILNVKQGKPDAIAKLRQAAKLEVDPSTPSQTTGAQLAQGVVASAILGKSLATRLGLRQEKQEASPERPSTNTTPASQKEKEKTPGSRVAEEEKERRAALEGKKDESEEQETDEDEEENVRGAAYRTNTYTATNKQGESTQIQSETPGAEATLRAATTASTARFGTPLPITTIEPPLTQPEEQTAPSKEAAANEPQEIIRRRAPKSRDRKKRGEEAKQAALHKDKEKSNEGAIDPVQATLERSAARKAKKEAQAVEQRFRSLYSSNPEFRNLLFLDLPSALKNEKVMQQVIDEWNEQQHQKKLRHIDTSFKELEKSDPEFRAYAYKVGLEHLQNDPDPYFRNLVAGKNISLTPEGWVMEQGTGKTIGHVLNIGLSNAEGLNTHYQIMSKALQGWHTRHPQPAKPRERLRAPRATRPSETIRKTAPTSRARGPQSLDQLAQITQTPQEQTDIRRMREFLRTQQGTRSSLQGLGQGTGTNGSISGGKGGATMLGAFIGLGATAALGETSTNTNQGEESNQGTTARLVVALRGLSREQAMTQAAQAKQAKEAQVEGLRLWQSSPDAQTEDSRAAEQTSTSASETEGTNTSPSSFPVRPISPLSENTPRLASEPQETDDLAAQLLAAEQELVQLNALESALQQLPSGSTIPNTFDPDLSGTPLSTTQETTPASTAASELSPAVPLSTSISTQDRTTTPSVQQAPTASTQPGKRTTIKQATGIPSIARRSSSRSSNSLISRLKNRALPLAFASMASLGAGQALERGTSYDDPRQMILNSDTSLPNENSESSPQAGNTMTPSETTNGEGDVPRSTLEEAQGVRAQSEQARANQEQFLGKSPTEGEGQPSSTQTPQQLPPEGPLSPSQQINTAAQINAAQQQDKQTAQNTQQNTPQPQAGATIAVKAPTPSSPTARLTAIKMSWDVIEGLMDGVGFAEFLVDANTALVNDRYLHFSSLPSLKIPGTSERTQRYINYSVIFLDGLIAVFLFFLVCLLVIAIVTIICGTSPACVIIAAAT